MMVVAWSALVAAMPGCFVVPGLELSGVGDALPDSFCLDRLHRKSEMGMHARDGPDNGATLAP